MPKQILFIHGGGAGAYEQGHKMVASLKDALGASVEVRYPRMPNPTQPDYEAWRARIEQELALLEGGVMLVGHSLGGSLLLKVLSEQTVGQPIGGLFLLAPPFWGTPDWGGEAYTLRDGFAAQLPPIPSILFYHSRDDAVVPFNHLARYAATLPQATFRAIEDGGHRFHDALSDVVADMGKVDQIEATTEGAHGA